MVTDPTVASLRRSSALWADGEETAVILKTYLVHSQGESTPRTINILNNFTRFIQAKGGHFCELWELIWPCFDPNRQLKEGHDHEQREHICWWHLVQIAVSHKSSFSCHRLTISHSPWHRHFISLIVERFWCFIMFRVHVVFPAYVSLAHICLPNSSQDLEQSARPTCVCTRRRYHTQKLLISQTAISFTDSSWASSRKTS